MRRCASTLPLALLAAMLSLPAAANIVSPRPESVQVTIYRGPSLDLSQSDAWGGEPDSTGLAMITETRRIEVPAGVSTLVFRGVADAIVPQTAALDGLPALVLESNFDYDLLSPGTLISKSVGRSVRLVRTDKATGRVSEQRAMLRSGPNGVMLDIDGRIEAFDCSGYAEKLVFDAVPEGLAEQPTLSMKIRAERAGRYTIQLSYLALGLNWAADYVATINADGRTLNLTGWITLVNQAATTFANAPTEVVAGELARTPDETRPPGPNQERYTRNCWPFGVFESRVLDEMVAHDLVPVMLAAPAPAAMREAIGVVDSYPSLDATLSELGDYKLYSLPAPTTVAARQSKQVRFLNEANVPFERFYSYRLSFDELASATDTTLRAPTATLRLQNERRAGLGKPLPAGIVSVLEPNAQSKGVVLAGEKRLQDTPVGLPFEIELGRAMDVWVEPVIVEDRTIESDDGPEQQTKVEVRFKNDKPIPVTVEYRHPAAKGLRIIEASRRHTMKLGDPLWTFKLPAGGRASLTYTVRRAD
ncbi:MAG: hypothetical protein GX535_02625 [Xanthomonadaceae bacterium]|nr:hypothetical protein [Xanthomonadaceae bacterium]